LGVGVALGAGAAFAAGFTISCEGAGALTDFGGVTDVGDALAGAFGGVFAALTVGLAVGLGAGVDLRAGGADGFFAGAAFFADEDALAMGFFGAVFLAWVAFADGFFTAITKASTTGPKRGPTQVDAKEGRDYTDGA
jgi:hypothetical protein